MILAESDKADFFPNVTLTGGALISAIAVAQGIIESRIARTLEIKRYTDTVRKNNGIIRLQYTPLVEIESVESRQLERNKRSFSQYSSSDNEWGLIAASDYTFDETDQLIEVSRRASNASQLVEYRVRYTSGFNFASNSQDVIIIKAIAGQMLSFLSMPSAQKGITSLSVSGQSVSYGSTKLEQQMSNQLAALEVYRPRVFPF